MNKRQAKKKQRNEDSIGILSYREDRKVMREWHEYEISRMRSRVIPEDVEMLIELGFYTEKEVADKLFRTKTKKPRYVQLRKVGSR